MSLLLSVSSLIWSFPKEELVTVVALWPHESMALLSVSFWHCCQDEATAAPDCISKSVHLQLG